MLRFPGPLVHGQGGGEGLQQDVVEQAGEEGEGKNYDRQEGWSGPVGLDRLLVTLLGHQTYKL